MVWFVPIAVAAVGVAAAAWKVVGQGPPPRPKRASPVPRQAPAAQSRPKSISASAFRKLDSAIDEFELRPHMESVPTVGEPWLGGRQAVRKAFARKLAKLREPEAAVVGWATHVYVCRSELQAARANLRGAIENLRRVRP